MLKIALDPVSQEKLHLLLIGEIRNLQERFRTACYTAHTLHVPVSRPDANTRYVVDLRHIERPGHTAFHELIVPVSR